MKIILALSTVALLAGCNLTSPPRAVEPPQSAGPIVNPPRVSPPSSGGRSSPPVARPPMSRPPMSQPPAGGDACGANRLQRLVGQPLPQPFPAEGTVRIYTTGSPVTLDHSPHRLNVEVDASNQRRIVRISCG